MQRAHGRGSTNREAWAHNQPETLHTVTIHRARRTSCPGHLTTEPHCSVSPGPYHLLPSEATHAQSLLLMGRRKKCHFPQPNQTKPNQTELNQELPKLAWRHTGEDRPWVLPLQPPCCGPELALGPPPNPGAPLRPSWSVQPGLPVGGWGIKDDGRETDADPSESRPSAIGDTTSPLASWTSTLIPVRTTIGPFRLQGQSLRGQVQRASQEHPPFP